MNTLSTALLLALALAAPEPAAGGEAIGTVRVVRGGATGEGAALERGRALAPGATLDTGALGFLELGLGADVRVRVSAATRVTLDVDGASSSSILRLASGRIWVQNGSSALRVITPFGVVRAFGRSSFIVEQTRSTGVVVAVRAGAAEFEADGARVRIARGQLVTRAPGAQVPPRARSGGGGLGDLVAFEASRALGDWTGARAWLLERVETAEITARPAGGFARADADRAGADTDTGGGLLEESIRPAPFFEDEVPPKGPNVRVEVTFGDE